MSFTIKQRDVNNTVSVPITTDFHSHVLPRVDDGSHSVEESLEMLKMSYAQGVRRIVATPHFYARHQDPDSFVKERDEAFDILRSAMEKEFTDGESYPEVLLGAEVSYFDGISHCEEINKLCIEGTKIVLVEMPFQRWNDKIIDEILEMKSGLDVIPVVAHVDRYFKIQPAKMINNLFGQDLLIQANAESFIDRKSRGRMLKLLQCDCIDFFGSDAHNTSLRFPNLGEASKIISEKCGVAIIEKINEFGDFVFEGANGED